MNTSTPMHRMLERYNHEAGNGLSPVFQVDEFSKLVIVTLNMGLEHMQIFLDSHEHALGEIKKACAGDDGLRSPAGFLTVALIKFQHNKSKERDL